MKQPLFPVLLIGILPLAQRQRHDDFPAQPHQLLNHAVLDGCEARKAVKDNHAPRKQPGSLQRTPENVQCFLRRDKVALNILCEAAVKRLQILQFLDKRSAVPGKPDQLLHILRADPVLHKFRDGALYLMDIALLVQKAPQHRQLILEIRRNLLEYKALSCIVQHRNFIAADLLHNAVVQPPEA